MFWGCRMNTFNKLMSLFLVLTLAACQAAKLTSVWSDDAYPDKPIKSALVVGITDNERDRRIFEDALAQQLMAHGVKATSSAALILKIAETSQESILAAAKKHGMQTILVTRTVGVEEQEVYYPPTYGVQGDPFLYPPHYRSFGSYYRNAYEYVVTPGYTTKYTNVKLESNLYRADTGQLIWSSASELFDPRSVNEAVKNLGSVIAESLRNKGLVP